MVYTPQTWHDYPQTDTPVDAARLTVMENGLRDAASAAGTPSYHHHGSLWRPHGEHVHVTRFDGAAVNVAPGEFKTVIVNGTAQIRLLRPYGGGLIGQLATRATLVSDGDSAVETDANGHFSQFRPRQPFGDDLFYAPPLMRAFDTTVLVIQDDAGSHAVSAASYSPDGLTEVKAGNNTKTITSANGGALPTVGSTANSATLYQFSWAGWQIGYVCTYSLTGITLQNLPFPTSAASGCPSYFLAWYSYDGGSPTTDQKTSVFTWYGDTYMPENMRKALYLQGCVPEFGGYTGTYDGYYSYAKASEYLNAYTWRFPLTTTIWLVDDATPTPIPYTTYLHELGHMLDYVLFRSCSVMGYTQTTATVPDAGTYYEPRPADALPNADDWGTFSNQQGRTVTLYRVADAPAVQNMWRAAQAAYPWVGGNAYYVYGEQEEPGHDNSARLEWTAQMLCAYLVWQVDTGVGADAFILAAPTSVSSQFRTWADTALAPWMT